MQLIEKFKNRWQSKSGYREVLIIALPLIISTGSWSLQNFIDRMFLAWYSQEALAASVPASLAVFSFVCLFIGLAGYVNTFVAQYFGSGQYEKIGSAIWQGYYVAILATLAVIPFYLIAQPLFRAMGHAPEVQQLEVDYFRILLYATPFTVISNAASCFYSGLGQTRILMAVNLFVTAINIVVDYLLVFGIGVFPEMGIQGAAWATTLSSAVGAVLIVCLVSRVRHEAKYKTRSAWRFDVAVFARLLRYGFPNGLQFQLELIAFTVFVVMIGKVGIMELTASNIALNINMLAFMPMMGMMIAVSTLVGQNLGEGNPLLAQRATWSAYHITFVFFAVLGLSFISLPELYIYPFSVRNHGADFAEVTQMVVILLRFVAVYCFFDAGAIIFSGALKGAGDTRFVAVAGVSIAWLVMVIPSALAIEYLDHKLYWPWFFLALNTASLCGVFLWRFVQGKWQSMLVVDVTPESGGPEEESDPQSNLPAIA